MKINRSLAWTAGAFMAVALVAAMGVSMRASADNGSEGGDHGNGNGLINAQAALSAAAGLSTSTFSVSIPGGDHGNGQNQGEGEQGASSMQESASVTPSGNFKLTGAKVVSVDANANTITATLYGITRTVSVAGASITGGGASMGLGSIQAGDVLSATGNYNEMTHTVTVNTVNDVSAKNANTSAIQSRISALMQLVQQLQAQLQAMSQSGSGSGN